MDFSVGSLCHRNVNCQNVRMHVTDLFFTAWSLDLDRLMSSRHFRNLDVASTDHGILTSKNNLQSSTSEKRHYNWLFHNVMALPSSTLLLSAHLESDWIRGCCGNAGRRQLDAHTHLLYGRQ